ncbi:UNVERIFIED_CONTAM: hypothetical protein K2H54_032903 [Gekko kuhli]
MSALRPPPSLPPIPVQPAIQEPPPSSRLFLTISPARLVEVRKAPLAAQGEEGEGSEDGQGSFGAAKAAGDVAVACCSLACDRLGHRRKMGIPLAPCRWGGVLMLAATEPSLLPAKQTPTPREADKAEKPFWIVIMRTTEGKLFSMVTA